MAKFTVVVFPDEENAVDVISSTWILPSLSAEQNSKEKVCRYPPTKVRGAKLAKLLASHSSPSSDWLICTCRILGEYGKNILINLSAYIGK